MEQKRERFSSRLGFILISAGCAIGLGNVWKFPYITGQYGGAAFVLIYIAFLILMGIPHSGGGTFCWPWQPAQYRPRHGRIGAERHQMALV